MDLAETLQRLYDSEINATITWLWDDGFDSLWSRIWNGRKLADQSTI